MPLKAPSAEKEQHDLAPGHPQSPEQTDLPAAAHHGQGHRLVDEKHSHKQGNGTEDRQIEAIGRDQAGHILGLGPRGGELHSRRQGLTHGIGCGGEFAVDDEIDIIQPADPVQEFLGLAQIHEQDCAFQRVKLSRSMENSRHVELAHQGAHRNGEGIAGAQVEAGRQGGAKHHPTRPGQKREEGLLIHVSAGNKPVIPEGALGKRVNAQEQGGLGLRAL